MTDPVTEQFAQRRQRCAHCGALPPTVNDWLRESVELVAPQADELVLVFYRRFFALTRGQVAALFPPDILTGKAGDPESEGAAQRDRIVKAVLAVAKYFDPDDAEAMETLNNVLDTFGFQHSNFAWPDGVNRGATFGQYRRAGMALFDAFHQIGGDQWRQEFDEAWNDAFDHIADRMLKAQKPDDQKVYGRQPRVNSDPIVARRRGEDLPQAGPLSA